MNIYPIDTLLQIAGPGANGLVFSNANGPADPTNVFLDVSDPTGAVTTYTYPDDVTRTATGCYYAQFTPGLDGIWKYQWRGTGAVQARSPVYQFLVQAGLTPA